MVDIVAAPPWVIEALGAFTSWSPLGLGGISGWPGVPGSVPAACPLFLLLLWALLLVLPLGRVLGVCGALLLSLPLPSSAGSGW